MFKNQDFLRQSKARCFTPPPRWQSKPTGLVLALVAAFVLFSACRSGSNPEEIIEIIDTPNGPTEIPTIVITGVGNYSGTLKLNYAEKITSKTTKTISGTMAAKGTVSLQSQPPKGALIVSIQAGPDTNQPIYIGRLIGSSAGISLKLNLVSSGNLELRPADSGGIIPIGTYAEFQLINGTLGGSYKQEADLDFMGGAEGLNVPSWEPVGTSTTAFTGTFNGDGNQIDRLSIDKSGIDNVGLFGYADSATFTGVHIKNGAITGKNNVGGILGQGTGNISFSSNNAQITGDYQVGGIVGNTTNNILFACYNTGDITGYGWYIGGLAGDFKGEVTACYNKGNIAGGNIGGLLGRVSYGFASKITASYNTGNVAAKREEGVGGLAGISYESGFEVIACYNTGKVSESASGLDWTYSLVYWGPSTLSACYWKKGSAKFGRTYGSGDIPSFVEFPTPDTSVAAWGEGDGTAANTYWKDGTTDGTMLPQLWYEK